MTISAVYSPDTYNGDNSTVEFAISFGFLSVSTNVKVTLKNKTTGALTLQTVTTHYSISGTNVTMVTAPTTTEQLLIELNPDFKQSSDYTENSALSAATIETDFDERTIESQYVEELANNSLKVDSIIGTSVDMAIVVPLDTDLSDRLIKFNAAGTGLETTIASTIGAYPVLDEDDMASDSATSLATQQSIKAYADSVASGMSNVVEDTTPQLGGMLDVNANAIGDGTRELITFTEDASAVNQVNIENEATGSGPIISAAGDDTNIDLIISGKGTGDITIGNYVLDGDQTVGAGQDNYVLKYNDSGSIISLEAEAAGGLGNVVEDTNPQLGGQLDVNGNALGNGTLELLTFTEDASAVNHVNLENEAAGSGPIISAAGDDTNIDLNLRGKATGNVILSDGTDATKTLSVELGGATSAKKMTLTSSQTDNRTITLPDATDTLVGKATTDTFTNKTYDANGTGNALSNVDIADLADGTDGELITWDANGAPAAVAVGTATHVLTSNGTGAAPTFQAAAGGGGGGKVLQVVSDTLTSTFSSSTNDALVDVTGLAATITPASTSNDIMVIATLSLGYNQSGGDVGYGAIKRGSTNPLLGDAASNRVLVQAVASHPTSGTMNTVVLTFLDSPATDSAVTYQVQGGADGGTWYVNRTSTDTDSVNFPRAASSIVLMEIDGT